MSYSICNTQMPNHVVGLILSKKRVNILLPIKVGMNVMVTILIITDVVIVASVAIVPKNYIFMQIGNFLYSLVYKIKQFV